MKEFIQNVANIKESGQELMAKRIGVSERVYNNLKDPNNPKLKLKYNNYFENIFIDCQVTTSNVEKHEGIEDKSKIEKILDSLLDDWNKSSNEAIRTTLKGHIIEWMMAYAVKNNIDINMDVKVPVSEYVDEDLHTDLFIDFHNNKLPNDGKYGIDLTTSFESYQEKSKRYKETANDKNKFLGIPVKIDQIDISEYLKNKANIDEHSSFLNNIAKMFIRNFSDQFVDDMTFAKIWGEISSAKIELYKEEINNKFTQQKESKIAPIKKIVRKTGPVARIDMNDEDNKRKMMESLSRNKKPNPINIFGKKT